MALARKLGLVAPLLLLPGVAFPQNIVSARAGLIHHSDGRVLLNEKQIVHKPAQFEEVKESEYLRTELGRAEVLLTPGIFLRMGEDTQIEMLSTRLSDVRVRLAAGSAIVEADELNKENSVTLLVRDVPVRLEHSGLYRFDVLEDESPRLRVFSGEALVAAPSGEVRLKGKKEVDLAGDFAVRKFDPEDTDPLDRWSRRRANYLAVANVSASRMAYASGSSFSSSSWIWNPYFGMYTFLPFRGIAWSPYGWGFYSPRAVHVLYNPPAASYAGGGGSGGPSYNSSYGYTTVPHTSGGTSGVIASSPSSPASSAGGGATVSHGGSTGGGGARR